jgi:predicted Zn-dependent protease
MNANLGLRSFYIAALIVLIGAFALLPIAPSHQMFRPRHVNPYLAHLSFEQLPAEQMRGPRVTVGEQFFTDAMNDYRHGDYNSSIKNLKFAVRHAANRAQWWLYLGVSYFLNRQGEFAVAALKNADFLAPQDLKPTARWYLAQAYLLGENVDKAMPLLKWISEQKSDYATAADSLAMHVQSVADNK